MIPPTMCRRPEFRLSPGFLLLSALMFYLDDGLGFLPWIALSALIHELGHIGAARLFGGRVEALSLEMSGAELRFAYSHPLGYAHENMIALAGPAMNLFAAVIALWSGAVLPAVTCVGLGLFNLLPVSPLDGGRVFFNLLAERFGPDTAERISAVAAGCVIGLMLGIGLIAAVKFANIMLLGLSVWLLLGIFRKM